MVAEFEKGCQFCARTLGGLGGGAVDGVGLCFQPKESDCTSMEEKPMLVRRCVARKGNARKFLRLVSPVNFAGTDITRSFTS